MSSSGLVIASNRGPLQFTLHPDGTLSSGRGTGGLISALVPALDGQRCTWIAAAISEGDRAAAARAVVGGGALPLAAPGLDGAELRLLRFDRGLYERHYHEVSNRVLWFLHHRLLDVGAVAFDAEFRESWACYRTVNQAFADACSTVAGPGAQVHVEDYHLGLAPALLRERRPDLRIAHQVCCPWSDPEWFGILPDGVGGQLLNGMLGADLVAFLTPRWAGNFLRCCEAAGFSVEQATATVRAGDGRGVRVRAFPLGVDGQLLRRLLAESQPERFASGDGGGRGDDGEPRLIVRVDRMEPTKNILRGLDGYAAFLEAHPTQQGKVCHLVITNLSRSGMTEYQRYHAAVEERVEEVNRRYGRPGWVPARLLVLDDHPRALRALAAADVVVVNPLWDGMNLVAKEAACVNDRDAVLILSRNAGAAADLGDGALLVNPFDVAALAETLAAALAMDPGERARRAALLRAAASRLPPRAWFALQRDALRPHSALSGEGAPASDLAAGD